MWFSDGRAFPEAAIRAVRAFEALYVWMGLGNAIRAIARKTGAPNLPCLSPAPAYAGTGRR
jgi:hypothetical protein